METVILITCLLLMGLLFFGMAMHRLWVLDWMQANAPTPPAPDAEKSEDKPALTKLGHPIEEIRMTA